MNTSYITVCESFVLDRNAGYNIIVYKLFILGRNT